MKFCCSLLLFIPAVCLIAQTPPPQPAQPTVTLSAENVGTKPVNVPPDKVVITVGDTKITAAQFDQIIDSLPEQYRASARGPSRKMFADNLVRVMVMSQEAKRRKLDETSSFKSQVMFQNANLLAQLVYEQLSKDAKVDDAELHKSYDEHKAEYEQVKARHILIRMQGSPLPVKPGQKDLTEAEALAKVQDLRSKIQAGEDFAKLATAESDDTGSGPRGGDLGAFKKGQMVPAFEQVAFSLKPGELSEPVKTQFGYHLIKVESHETKSFDEMKPDLEKRLRPELAQKAMQDLEKKAGPVLDPEFFGTNTPATPIPLTPPAK